MNLCAYNNYYSNQFYKKGVTIRLRNKKYPFIPDSCLIDNTFKNNKYYKARNLVSYSTNSASVFTQETPAVQAPEQAPEQELPPANVPAAPAEPGTTPNEKPEETGYIAVSVFTASGALPVEGAVVTVYIIDREGEENVISHQVTDANGQVPKIELPVRYNRLDPLESSQYYYNTYNLRVQAINYYTVNIIGFRVFPNTTTNFNIDLIPVAVGPTVAVPNQTFVIPPSPIDISN